MTQKMSSLLIMASALGLKLIEKVSHFLATVCKLGFGVDLVVVVIVIAA
jgi:hypothetical protein